MVSAQIQGVSCPETRFSRWFTFLKKGQKRSLSGRYPTQNGATPILETTLKPYETTLKQPIFVKFLGTFYLENTLKLLENI